MGTGSITEVKWLGKDLCPYKWSGVKWLSDGKDGKDPGESQSVQVVLVIIFFLFPYFNQVSSGIII